jgi:hypothetical protein
MIETVLFCVGAALLLVAVRLRRQQLRLEERRTVQWVHHGFDSQSVSQRLHDVRQTHADIVHARQSDLSYQSELLLQARRAVRLLGFFQRGADNDKFQS